MQRLISARPCFFDLRTEIDDPTCDIYQVHPSVFVFIISNAALHLSIFSAWP